MRQQKFDWLKNIWSACLTPNPTSEQKEYLRLLNARIKQRAKRTRRAERRDRAQALAVIKGAWRIKE